MRPLIYLLFFANWSPFITKCFSQDYLTIQKEADEYFNKNDFQNALHIGQSALDQAELTVGKSHIDYAKILRDVSVYNSYSGNADQAITQMEEALSIIIKLKGEKSKEYNETQEYFATVLFLSGEYPRAEQLLLQNDELGIKLHGEFSRERAVTLSTLSVVQIELKKNEEARKNILICQNIFEKLNMTDTVEYASVLNNLASVSHSLGDYLGAEKSYKSAAKVYKKNNLDKSLEFSVLIQNLGVLYMDMGKYEDARAMFIKDLNMKKEFAGEESVEYSASLNNLAHLYSTLGQYSEAEPLYLKALSIKEKTLGKEHPSYLRQQNNLSLLLYDLGRQEESIALMQKCFSVVKKEKISNPVNYAFYASNLAFLYSRTEKYDEAVKLYKESIEIYLEQYGETFGDYTTELGSLAVVYMNMFEDKLAKDLLEKAARISKAADQYYSKENLELLNNLACVYQADKNSDKAVEVMRNVVKIAKEIYEEKHPSYMNYLFNLGVFLDEQMKWQEAEQIYTQLIETDFYNLEHNFSSMSESEKGSFYSTVSIHFDVVYRFAIDRAKENPAILSKVLDYRIATKAMLLHSSNKVRNNILQSKDSSLINSYLKWKSEKDYLMKLYSLPKRELALLKVKPDSIEKEVNAMEKQLSQKSVFGNQSLNKITWKEVQSNLQPGEAAVEIIRVYSPYADEKDKVFYIAIIIDKTTKEYPRMAVMDDGYEMETQYCKQYRDDVFDSTKKENTYLHFWEKIEKELNGITKIYISVDGIYAKVNLNSILNPARNSYLIDIFDFHYISTLRDLAEKDSTSNKSNTAVLFGFPDYTYALPVASNSSSEPLTADYLIERKKQAGNAFYLDPLPATKKEVEAVAALMKEKGWQVNSFLASSAQEQKLKSISSPTVIHIATHGYFSRDVDASFTPATSMLADKMAKNPLLRSGLMMAGASNAYSMNYSNLANWTEQEDGILTAYEAMNLKLDKTELVVLSACETGLGEIRNGEGVYGLQRAFMTAGAKTVIMSLWTVSDEATQKLMSLFYSKWLETGDKHKSFQYAQIELKKKYPDPYFWSAFVMVGK